MLKSCLVTPQDLSLHCGVLHSKTKRCSFNFPCLNTTCNFKRRSVCISQPPKTLPAATSIFFFNDETLCSPSAEIIPKLVSVAVKSTINQCTMSAFHLLEISLLLCGLTNLRSWYLTGYFTQVCKKTPHQCKLPVRQFEVTAKVKQLVIVQKKFHFKAERCQFTLTCQKRIRGSFPATVLWQQAKKRKKIVLGSLTGCAVVLPSNLSEKIKYTQRIKCLKGSTKYFPYKKSLA